MAFQTKAHHLLTSAAPRYFLFTSARLPRATRHPNTSRRVYSSQSPLGTGPSPPRLPKEEQEIFESLQRKSTGAFSTPRETEAPLPTSKDDAQPKVPKEDTIPEAGSNQASASNAPDQSLNKKATIATGDGKELHPDVRRGARPEFEGDINPRTGEVGGPKNEPLRWGGEGEWSYNGRTTDF